MKKNFKYVLWLACLPCCVSTQSTLQTAPTVPKKQFRITVGESLPVSTRFASEFSDAAKIAVNRAKNSNYQPLTEREEAELVESAIATALLQPSPITIVDGRYGVLDNLDVGLRWAGPSFRLDSKLWFGDPFAEIDISAGLGVTTHTGIGASIAGKAFEIFEYVDLVDFKRRDFDATLYFSSASADVFGFYASLRYTRSMIQVRSELTGVATQSGASVEDVDEGAHVFNGTGGMRLRAGPCMLFAELSVAKMQFEPIVLDEKRQLSGILVEPAFGANLTF